MFAGSYASFFNQAYHLTHFLLAFLVAYIFLPQLMFKPVDGNRADNYFANFLRMSLFVIIVGYILVVSKLLEFIGFSAAIIAWIFLTRGRQQGLNRSLEIVVALFYDLIETPYLIRQQFSRFYAWIRKRGRTEKGKSRLVVLSARSGAGHRIPFQKLLYFVMFFAILGVSVYLRWTDAVTNPAPPMSDGVVTLAWVKYVNLRYLFHDGIYPQGYYISDDFVNKFTFINPLYTVKYMGAMATTVVVLGLYYVTSRMGRPYQVAGLIAALIYGVFGYTLLPVEWSRQAATESQEFGFMFVLPTIYFGYRYLRTGHRTELATVFAGLTVAGLIHTLSYVLASIGCISVVLSFLILDRKKKWWRFFFAFLAGVASGVISLAPIELGRLFHRTVNSSAASFASATTQTVGAHATPAPTLTPMMKIAVVAILVLMVAVIRARLKGRRETAWLSAGIFGFLMFLFFYVGGPVSKSIVILSRSQDLWAIAAAFTIGFSLQTFSDFIHRRGFLRALEKVALVAVVCVPMFILPPKPIIPYKMQWNAAAAQVLRIDSQFKTSTYMLVAPDEEYALVLGSGYLMSPADFVKMYNPDLKPLTRNGQSKPDTNIAANVFIYYQKQIFEVPKYQTQVYALEAPIYRQEENNRAMLDKWLQAYRQAHHGVTVYYNGPKLTIYYIHNNIPDPNAAVTHLNARGLFSHTPLTTSNGTSG